jgi:hypothetical protein
MHRAFPLWSILLLTAVVPLAQGQSAAPALLPADRPLEQAIDYYIDAGIKAAGTQAAPPADDATLVRRLMLDLAGRIPTLAETTAYVADTAADKKVRLVERLLATPAFARHQGREFLALLQTAEPGRRAARSGPLGSYLQAAFAENRSWDRIFRELILPDETDARTRGSGEFLKSRLKDLNRLTIDVSTVFFGVNISCAQCHDHPQVADWTQDHFYGLKAFFARTFEAAGFVGESDAGVVKYAPHKGKEKLAPVMFLTGKTLAIPGLHEPTREEKQKVQRLIEAVKKSKKAPPRPSYSLRARLVETALEPGQRDYFARSIVNRLWNEFFGRGLVMPLDQMHAANPPSHPELLQWLARDLIEHGYDLRRLVRGLVLSNAYARSTRWVSAGAPPAENLFAVARVRPLTPMQMALSLRLASTNPQSLPADRTGLEKRLDSLEKSAEHLADLFPRPRENFQVGVSEALLFANNAALLKELLDGPGTLPARLQALPDISARAELAVRTVLGRTPQPEEIQALGDYLRQRPDRPGPACQQMVWALLTSAEFRFNH